MTIPGIRSLPRAPHNVTVVAHVLITIVGIGCVTFLAGVGKVDGATAVVVIVSALGIAGPSMGRPQQPAPPSEPSAGG